MVVNFEMGLGATPSRKMASFKLCEIGSSSKKVWVSKCRKSIYVKIGLLASSPSSTVVLTYGTLEGLDGQT